MKTLNTLITFSKCSSSYEVSRTKRKKARDKCPQINNIRLLFARNCMFSNAKLLMLVLGSLKNIFLPQNRCAVVGNVDAGKSTLLGVLTHGELDNGRGYARQKLFRHKHEAESGRTSSVGNDILGFDSSGQVVNKPDHGNLDWVRYVQNTTQH